MLISAAHEDIEKYGELAYGLALDPARSCYPTYADGIKTKADFLAAAERALASEMAELLLFIQDGAVEGWLSYFWINEDKYLQLDGCNVRHGTTAALTELLDRLEARFAGYTAYFGFPGENREAADFLRARGFDCVERDWNFSFFFDAIRPRSAPAALKRSPAGTLTFSAPYTAQSLTRTGAVTASLTRWTIGTSSFTAKAPAPPRQYFSPAAAGTMRYTARRSPTALSGMPFSVR